MVQFLLLTIYPSSSIALHQSFGVLNVMKETEGSQASKGAWDTKRQQQQMKNMACWLVCAGEAQGKTPWSSQHRMLRSASETLE